MVCLRFPIITIMNMKLFCRLRSRFFVAGPVLSNVLFSHSSSHSNPQKFHSTSTRDTLRRLVVVMDLDECMVHAHQFGDDNDKERHVVSRKNFSVERTKEEENQSKDKPRVESVRIMMEDNTPVHFRLRPGVREFLKDISTVADVYAFTAGWFTLLFLLSVCFILKGYYFPLY